MKAEHYQVIYPQDDGDLLVAFTYWPGAPQTYWQPADEPEIEITAIAQVGTVANSEGLLELWQYDEALNEFLWKSADLAEVV